MAIRDVALFPDPRLGRRSEPVIQVTDDVRALAIDLIDTMRAQRCSGLSAVQIGEALQMVVIRDGLSGTAGPVVLINPRIVAASRHTSTASEGCASSPGLFREVERPAEVEVSYTDLDGRARGLKASGLLATCLQHQLDHLAGVAFVGDQAMDQP